MPIFTYCDQDPEAPKESVILGHKFVNILHGGSPVKVTCENIARKLRGREHAGIVEQIVQSDEDFNNDLKGNATKTIIPAPKTIREEVAEIVLSKAYDDLKAFRDSNGLSKDLKKKAELQSAIIDFLVAEREAAEKLAAESGEENASN